MAQDQTWTKLVRQAQKGHKEDINKLAREAKGRLCAYIYRVTLNYDLTEDISQEVLLQMFKSLNQLKSVKSFWPWLYQIAQNKIQEHYKVKYKKSPAFGEAFYKNFTLQRSKYHQEDGLRQLLKKELSKKVVVAMKQLKQQYRAVLSLRCFEQLSYSEIAVAMDCSEVRARILFYRAKQALKKQLTHQGLKKGFLLVCLGLFGRLTAPARAATVTVSASSVKVGVMTAIIATAGTNLGIATVTATAVGLATMGGISVLSEATLPERSEVRSINYTIQAPDTSQGPTSNLSQGAFEQWFACPDGIDGPLFMRTQRWDAKQTNRLSAWLENGDGNYFYSTDNKIHINNYRAFWSSLRVRRLPTDPADFTNFLSKMVGSRSGVEYKRDCKTGLLRYALDDRFAEARNFRTNYKYNKLNESLFEYYFSEDIPVIDERDQMHKRGWTYFCINGEINNQTISAMGQIPFVYNTSKEYPAWMKLKIGNELEIIDCMNGACLQRADGTVIAAYKPGTFFKGLLRPWMGMHTIDIIRRDAARRRVAFRTMPVKYRENVIVRVYHEDEHNNTELVYGIDMENDIIEYIRFEVRNRIIGSLEFSYLQDIEQEGEEFIAPAIAQSPETPARNGPGILWLVDLAQGNLGK
ncbi:MAG: sigma-70 family RNA polymerase sigma factor [Sedimentisphaerales bacterium]|nr:sigma-70 family RNA polymerase sigma factor [Sedimentisphaerales bacterium]